MLGFKARGKSGLAVQSRGVVDILLLMVAEVMSKDSFAICG